jgi:transcriptional regulator GlxA family with amidase domain
VPPQREGGQRQFIDRPVPECSADSLGPLLDWMLTHLDVEHTVADLARRATMSERTFARRFVNETGTTPLRWLTRQRVLHARRLLEDTDLSVDAVAARCGFGSATLLRHHFRKVVGVAPADYRRLTIDPARDRSHSPRARGGRYWAGQTRIPTTCVPSAGDVDPSTRRPGAREEQ